MRHPYHLKVITDEFNVITVAIVVIALAFVAWMVIFLWRKMIEERDKIKTELPALIVGELMTHDEFLHLHQRVFEAETKLEYIETRLDAHIAEAQSTGGG